MKEVQKVKGDKSSDPYATLHLLKGFLYDSDEMNTLVLRSHQNDVIFEEHIEGSKIGDERAFRGLLWGGNPRPLLSGHRYRFFRYTRCKIV